MTKTPFWFRSVNPVSVLLAPVSAVYSVLSKVVSISRLFCGKTSKTPVISIEKTHVGGPGSTPLVREIARYLGAPVVMPGRGRGVKIKASDGARDVGAAAKMLAMSGADVYVGNTAESIDLIDYSESKAPAVVLDGSRPRARNGISVLLLDEGIGNGLLLPAGPMRGTLRSGVRRNDAVLLGRDVAPAAAARVMRIAKNAKKPVFFIKNEFDATGLFGRYVAFSCGNAGRFWAALRGTVSMRVVEKVPFRKNHFHTRDEIVRLFQSAKKYEARLVCAERDWVTLPRNIRQKIRFAPEKAALPPNFYIWLEKKLGANNEGN
ncbi:MAG: tetraacyldisaccharide 4'-kinase [Rickettsiales bacterium]|jgi:tetraacyldisaccharide 4'-kinase|nr:tetraacyldisaccharide 4'-kinase [Rickettsiales bacterium]